MIRQVNIEDANELAEIYNYYIENTIVTFEELAIDAEEMKKRILEVVQKYPWIVYEENGQIIGYAYASVYKNRSAYNRSVESTVYLNSKNTSKGIGSKLYAELIKQLKEMRIHVIVGIISLPNEESIALHEKFGFKKVAHFKEIGNKFNKWVDVGYWQLTI